MPLSLYIHFPWCVKKCPYCDFASYEKSAVSREDYLSAIILEMSRQKEKRNIVGALDTIFFGGGTPSLLSPDEIRRIIVAAQETFGIGDGAEISIECNPGTINVEKLRGYVAAGVNRISIGVQSTSDESLAKLGRIHSAAEARQAVEIAKESGFATISMDMMYGLPGQSLDDWKRDLSEAISWRPDHLSAYMLKPPAEWIVPNEDILADMYFLTTELCENAGLFQYEVSNFAKHGKECRHNIVYWSRLPYIGLGPSANSFISDTRWMNEPTIEKYIALMGNGTAEAMEETILSSMARDEAIMLSLRTREGIDLKRFSDEFGGTSANILKRSFDGLIEAGFANLEAGRILLTTKGLLAADEIAAQVAAIVDEISSSQKTKKIPD